MKKILSTIVAIIISFFICFSVFADEMVIIHEVVDGKSEDYKVKLEAIHDLATMVKNIKNGQFKLGNKCFIEDIYFDGDITHVKISCKKLLGQ